MERGVKTKLIAVEYSKDGELKDIYISTVDWITTFELNIYPFKSFD